MPDIRTEIPQRQQQLCLFVPYFNLHDKKIHTLLEKWSEFRLHVITAEGLKGRAALLRLPRTHARAHTRARTHTHTHTHAHAHTHTGQNTKNERKPVDNERQQKNATQQDGRETKYLLNLASVLETL